MIDRDYWESMRDYSTYTRNEDKVQDHHDDPQPTKAPWEVVNDLLKDTFGGNDE
jgi:hypothetical protein